jgi:sugar fermentation stimulation protein A
LAHLGNTEAPPVALFLIHTQEVDWFMPDYHTDLAFSEMLLAVRNRIRIIPVALRWRDDLSLDGTVKHVKIPWAHVANEAQDRGSYLLLLEMRRRVQLEIGQLGKRSFEKGHYIYVGSAMTNLSARIDRHLRLRKNPHWHIDYLRACADDAVALPVRSAQRLEELMCIALQNEFTPGPEGFGASDSPCRTHLFYAPENPLRLARFHQLLQRFRMRPPDRFQGKGM